MSKTSDIYALQLIMVIMAICDKYDLPKEEVFKIAEDIIKENTKV